MIHSNDADLHSSGNDDGTLFDDTGLPINVTSVDLGDQDEDPAYVQLDKRSKWPKHSPGCLMVDKVKGLLSS